MPDIHDYIRALRGPILVTGASGFVGANLYKTIASVRDDVYAVVRHAKGWRLSGVSDERIVAVDLNDAVASKNLVDSMVPQTVLDCMAYGAYSFETNASLIYQTNFQSLVNLVELLAERRIAAYVHAGSSAEYGTNCAAPGESDRSEPNSSWGHTGTSHASICAYIRCTAHWKIHRD
jgi:nucleoside-diphosphate-sugar epimerase